MEGVCLLMRIVVFCLILGIGMAVSACSPRHVASSKSPSPQPSASPPAEAETGPTPPASASIRLIDFANFTYPAKPVFSGGFKRFTLQRGKYEGGDGQAPINLAYVAYGDVTGDGVDEALVVLGVSVRGTAIPHVVYIYEQQKNSPKLMWAFQTGDRADGGLRQVYAEGGELIVEQFYSPDKLGGKCPACPSQYTRAIYYWQGNTFRQKGRKQILPNPDPEGPASPIMRHYGDSEDKGG